MIKTGKFYANPTETMYAISVPKNFMLTIAPSDEVEISINDNQNYQTYYKDEFFTFMDRYDNINKLYIKTTGATDVLIRYWIY